MQKDDALIRVLVVDDEPLIRLVLARHLKKNALVKTVSTAEDALAEIKKQHYDLCFLDVFLPGMSGLEALKIINRLSPQTKVAIITGSILKETIIEEIKQHAVAFIEKPFTLAQIEEVTAKVNQG